MGFALRRFFRDQQNNVYRLPNATLERMLRHPKSNAVPRFAQQRVRMTEVAVEHVNRQLTHVVRDDVQHFDVR
jgi:hypothetical protein